jgi:glycosyltransferase involved in cell wall biosynthesis
VAPIGFAPVSLAADPRTRGSASSAARDDRSWAGRRIALFVNSVEMGGVEEHVRQIAEGFIARGADVLLICPESTDISPLARAAAAAGAKPIRLTLSWNTVGRAAVGRFSELVRLLRSERVDVLHVHLTGYTGGRWALLAGMLARTNAVICTLQIAPDKPVTWSVRLDRRLINAIVDRFIAVSEVTRGRLIRFLGQSAEKTVVIPNAVELPRYVRKPLQTREQLLSSIGVPPDATIVGCVARLSPQKGIAHLIEATPAILRELPDAHVVLVGEGPLRAELTARVANLGLAGRIHFAGNQKDVPAWLAAMDVFVLPSLFEGLPLSILEAMAAGLPVIATAVDGTPEAVDDGVTGRLIPPEDPAAIAAAVVDVLKTPGLAARYGAAGRARAQLFSESALIDRLAAVYSAVLPPRR